jgi:hypothetical protein
MKKAHQDNPRRGPATLGCLLPNAPFAGIESLGEALAGGGLDQFSDFT